MTKIRFIQYDTTPRSDIALFFYTVRLAGQTLFEQMFILGTGNILAILLLPILLLTPPLLGGLWRCAMLAAIEEEIEFRTLIEEAKQNAGRAWILVLVSLPLYLVVVMNVIFYLPRNAPLPFEAGPVFYDVMVGVWAAVGVIWTVICLFMAGWWTFEPEARLRDVIQGALFLTIRHALFVIFLIVLLALLTAIHLFIPALVVVLTWPVLATFSVRSVQVLRYGVPEKIPDEILLKV